MGQNKESYIARTSGLKAKDYLGNDDGISPLPEEVPLISFNIGRQSNEAPK